MASVTGVTATHIDELLDEMVVAVRVDSGQLVYEKRSGEEVNGGELVDSDFAVGAAWPIGSIFTSTVPTNPADLLGIGTWVRYGQGRVLVSQDSTQPEFDAPGEVGGSKEITLATENLPSHTHSIDHNHSSFLTNSAGGHNHLLSVGWRTNVSVSGSSSSVTRVGGAGDGDIDDSENGVTGSVASHQHTVDVPAYAGSSGAAGSGTPYSHLPPYIVVYIWKRTA